MSTSARGPANLTLSADTGTGGKLTRQATIDGHHAQSIISVDAPQESIQSLILTATDGGDGRGGSCTVAPAGGTMTGTDYCNQKKWPQQIPTNVVGLDWNDATSSFRELGCFNVGKSISTDGHDVGTDTIYTMRPTEIVSASPMVGTSVSLSTVVDLRVRPSS